MASAAFATQSVQGLSQLSVVKGQQAGWEGAEAQGISVFHIGRSLWDCVCSVLTVNDGLWWCGLSLGPITYPGLVRMCRGKSVCCRATVCVSLCLPAACIACALLMCLQLLAFAACVLALQMCMLCGIGSVDMQQVLVRGTYGTVISLHKPVISPAGAVAVSSAPHSCASACCRFTVTSRTLSMSLLYHAHSLSSLYHKLRGYTPLANADCIVTQLVNIKGSNTSHIAAPSRRGVMQIAKPVLPHIST